MTKRDGGIEYIAFSLPAADAKALRQLARRLCYVNVEPLAVELFRVGLQSVDQRFEPASRFGEFIRARNSVRGGSGEKKNPSRRSLGASADARKRTGRSGRLPRRGERA